MNAAATIDPTLEIRAAAPSITVRFVDDRRTGKCWFEEKLSDGQWVVIDETRMVCEGNSRHALAEVIERRRQQRLMIFRNIGKEEVFPIL